MFSSFHSDAFFLSAIDSVSNSLQYFCELTLQDAERFLKHSPSLIATACAAVAMHSLEVLVPVRGVDYFSLPLFFLFDASLTMKVGVSWNRFGADALGACIADVCAMLYSSRDVNAVREKYSRSKWLRVALLPVISIA